MTTKDDLRGLTLDEIFALRGKLTAPIPVADRNRPLVLSFSQQRLWFLAQMTGASEAYHISLGLRLTGQLNEDAFRRSLNVLVARHETLRTTFFTLDGEAFQRVGPADAEFSLQREDLRGLGADALWQRLRDAVKAPFDLEQGPLVRGILLELSDEEHVLLITMHHIVSDGWSAGIFVRELSALYRAYCSAEEFLLPPLPIQYADYAAWQRQWLTGETFAQQSAYWQRTLSGAPALLQLPTDHPRPDYQDFDGNYVLVHLDETLTSGLKDLSQRHSLTLFMTVLTGWALVLSRLADQQDVVIGIPSANRGRSEIEGLIGFFVSTLALRIDLSEAATVAALLEQVKRVALEAQAHQDLPFEQIVELVKPVRNLGHTPIFQVMFAWQNNERTTFDLPGLIVDRIRAGEPAAKFDLTLNLGEVDGKIVGQIIYATSLFERQTIERYAEYLRKALSEMVADANRPAAALPILSDAERQQLLVEWNATEADYPHDKCIHDLFAEQVERAPEATAVVYEDQSLSYGELNARANRLAHHLRSLGVKPDAPVAICVERSLEMIVGLLAILKAGGCYLPLDPEYPPERLSFMLKDAAPKIILTHAAVRRQLEETLVRSNFSGTVLDLDRDADDWAHCSASNPSSEAIGLKPHHLAYIIYTSGSTGEPKGVMVEHKNIVNHTIWFNEQYKLDASDFVLQRTPFSFDASVWEIFCPISVGARIKMIPARCHGDPEQIKKELIAGISVFQSVPALISSLIEQRAFAEAKTLRLVFSGGDRLSPRVLEIADQCPGQIHNLYGPTEASIDSTAWECRGELLGKSFPIGRPISNTRIYLLDGMGNPVPQGVSGEIYIGGAGVARGYLNRPELTAERFIASPFVAGDRLYKTGDLGRYLADGNIEFLGRNDFQVKIRGFRIELGEIEARLLSHPSVREAVVIAREDEPGNKRLVAYYTAKEETGAEELRRYLSISLPDYMVPAAYVRLDVLPLTLNGKLDRKALPAPEDDAYGRKAYEAPVGPAEAAIAEIWSEVLGVAQIGRHDDFFELGGHSLLAIRVLERMRRALKIDVPLQALFSQASISKICDTYVPRSYPNPFYNTISNYFENIPVALIKKNSTPPLFLFHAIGGGIFAYSQLIELLSNDICLYGVHNFSSEMASADTINDIVSIYAKHILQIEPRGPYRFLGYSFGGVIATEVARELGKIGRRVDMLALIDTGPISGDGPTDPLSMWASFVSFVSQAYKISAPVIVDGRSIAKFQLLFDRLNGMEKKKETSHLTVEQLETSYTVFRRLVTAANSFVQTPYGGSTLHYVASRSALSAERGERVRRLQKVWPAAEIVEMDCDHFAIMNGEPIKKISRHLIPRLLEQR